MVKNDSRKGRNNLHLEYTEKICFVVCTSKIMMIIMPYIITTITITIALPLHYYALIFDIH